MADVRDLVTWILDMIERGRTGTCNATGQEVSLARVIDACNDVTRGGARPVWVDEDFLVERGVTPWTELPLWMRPPGAKRLTTSNALACDAGLSFRPLETTAADVFQWDAARPRPIPRGPAGTRYVVETLTREGEADLLERWARRSGRPAHP